MQGESDAFQVKTATNYAAHLENFIQDIRKEFSQYAADDGIAFVDAYIAENPAYWVYYEMVNNGKREVAERSPLNVVVDTSMLVCTGEPVENPDVPHYDSLSEIKLGYMFAEQVATFIGWIGIAQFICFTTQLNMPSPFTLTALCIKPIP